VTGRILIFLLAGLACAAPGCSDSGSTAESDAQRVASEEASEDPQAPRPQVVQALPRRAPIGTGSVAILQPDGTASAPIEAPAVVQEVIHAGNLISNSPYIWGGGHGRWLDDGYDCSGSVSFALFAGDLLSSPLTSGGFMSWGEPGPGRWITIYTNPGHVYMVVAGLRFDTSGRTRLGSRWQPEVRPAGGFVVRHPPGL
jgi:cell wall-associated NlpC family hydrolase